MLIDKKKDEKRKECPTVNILLYYDHLMTPDIDVVAITCVNGNTSLDNVLHNVQRILAVCRRTDIPVFRGASRSLLQHPEDASYYHGQDGLGDADTDGEDLTLIQPIQSEHAVDALSRIVLASVEVVKTASSTTLKSKLQAWLELRSTTEAALKEALEQGNIKKAAHLKEELFVFSERITNTHALLASKLGPGWSSQPTDLLPTVSVLALGPLTNIALALRMNPTVSVAVEDVFIMGGLTEGKGNVPHHFAAEFNFYIDPEAAHITIEMFPRSYLISFECTLNASISYDVLDAWRTIDTPRSRFFLKICKTIRDRAVFGERYISCDMIAAVAMVQIMAGRGAFQLRHVGIEFDSIPS